jgi:hypothetical protein
MVRAASLTLTLTLLSACSSSTTRTDDAGGDGGPAFGRCGAEVHACVCAGSTLSACLGLEPDCSACLSDHAESCCGPESSAYYACVERVQMPAGPCAADDAACISMACATEASALQSCLSSPACEAAMPACTGTWPIACD